MNKSKISRILYGIADSLKEIAEELQKPDTEPTVRDVFGYNVRIINALYKLDPRVPDDTLEHFASTYTIEDLYKIRNCGQKSIKEIIDKLSEYKFVLSLR